MNSLNRLTDDEGIHMTDEEDEFSAVPRQSEILKSVSYYLHHQYYRSELGGGGEIKKKILFQMSVQGGKQIPC